MAYPLFPVGANDWAFQRELNLVATHKKRLYLPNIFPYSNLYFPLDGDFTNYGYTWAGASVLGGYDNLFVPEGRREFTQDSRMGMAAKVGKLGRVMPAGENLPAAFTVSMWFKGGAFGVYDLYSKVNDASPTAKLYKIKLSRDTITGMRLQLYVGDGVAEVLVYTSTVSLDSTANNWHNFILVDNNGTVDSYIDGVLDDTVIYIRPDAADQEYTSEYFSGSIGNSLILDEISQWPFALTGVNAAVLYALDNKDTNGRDLGYWDFERSFPCRDTHIFGGGQRSSIEKKNLGREMTKNDRLIVCPVPDWHIGVQDSLIIEGIDYEIMVIQIAGGVNQHLQIFCKSIE